MQLVLLVSNFRRNPDFLRGITGRDFEGIFRDIFEEIRKEISGETYEIFHKEYPGADLQQTPRKNFQRVPISISKGVPGKIFGRKFMVIFF